MSQGGPNNPGGRGPGGAADPDATIPVNRPRSAQKEASEPGIAIPDSWDVRMSAQGMPAPKPKAKPPPRAPLRQPPPPLAAPMPRGATQKPHARLVSIRPKNRPSRTVMVLGFLAIVAVTAAAAAVALKMTVPSKSPVATASAVSPSAVAPKPQPGAVQPGAVQPGAVQPGAVQPGAVQPTPTGTVKPSAPPPPSPAPPAPADVGTCFAQLLPKKAFGKKTPKLDRLCSGTRAYSTMLKLKTYIVRAGGAYRITPAMDEWSKLGWFETAAFSAMRAHCCPDAKALTVKKQFARCKMEAALASIADAIDDDAKMKEALNTYRDSAKCIAKRGDGYLWGRLNSPYGGEEAYFDRIYKRLRKARGR